MNVQKLADNSIRMFIEYRDRHGKTEEEARSCAVAEMVEGEKAEIPGITPNTKEDSQNDIQQLKDSISLLNKVCDYMLNGPHKHYGVDCAEQDLRSAIAKLESI